jgi:anti-sigma regulatory factor (Ser/Thr protein kinase)
LLEAGVNGTTGDDLLMAATEAFINAVEHPVERASDRIVVRGEIDADRRVAFEIEDDGRWQPHADQARDHFGFLLMRAGVDSVDVARSDAGTIVTLIRRV